MPTNYEVVTVDGEEFFQWKSVLRIPKNWTPDSGVFIAVAPPGGIANVPAAIKGDTGFTPTIRNVNLTELANDDPTEASATWTVVTPGTDDAAPVFDLDLELHAGAPGNDGTLTILDADDFDDTGQTAGYVLALNATNDGVVSVARKVGNWYWPTSFTSLSNASGANTIGQVTVASQPWDWRPACQGQGLVSYDGADCQVDLLARVANATTGDIAARGFGTVGPGTCVPVLSAGAPAGSTATYAKVSSGGAATIYFRAEQQGAGADTFDMSNTRMWFAVKVDPIA